MNRIVDKNLKVDFHIHSKASFHKDGKKVNNNTKENINVLIEKLVKNNVDMVSISDHDFFDYDLYSKLKDKEFDGTFKKVLPAVEFSVKFDTKENLENNTHVVCIFDDQDNDKIKKINEYLLDDNKKIIYDQNKKFSEDRFLKILKRIDLDVVMIAHQKGSMSSKNVEKNDVSKLGKWRLNEFLSSEFFDSYEFKNPTNGIFNNLFKKKINDKYDVVRFITGSDCHVWDVYPQMDMEDIETDFQHTYLKCLPSFRGIAMALTDDSRISLNDYSFSIDDKKLDYLTINNNGNVQKIPLSRGLNVIIGDNSIGKSLLLHKLTSYEHISKQEIKVGYEKYLSDHNIEIDTIIPSNSIYEYDFQGAIRANFDTDNPGYRNEFLKSKYPEDISATPYVDYIKAELDNLYQKLDSKFSFDDEYNKLITLELLSEDVKNKQLSAIKYNLKLTSIISEKHKIVEAIKVVIAKIDLLLKTQLNTDETKYIEDTKIELNKLLIKYSLEHTTLTNKKNLINTINTGIQNFNEHMKDYKDSLQNKEDALNENADIIATVIAQLQLYKADISEYDFTIEDKEIELAKEIYGEYYFIKRFTNNKTKIDSKYYKEIINKTLIKNSEIDVTNITKKKLFDLIPNKNEIEKKQDGLELLKNRMKVIINNEFTNKSVILSNDKDITDSLSQGLNSTMYFDILSHDIREGIYLVDQPEDDISQSGIRISIIDDFKSMRNKRQVILVTHNPQFVINLDVDNVICIEKTEYNNLLIHNGALEYKDEKTNILELVLNHLDGGLESIRKRWKRYEKNIEIN